jgi:hypothetical protein
MRFSARFGLGLIPVCTLLLVTTGCTDGKFRGLDSTTKDHNSNDSEIPAGEKSPEEPRVDEPTWINGATLTCDWQSIEQENSAGIGCGLRDRDGEKLEKREQTVARSWSITDANGSSVPFSRPLDDTREFDIALSIVGKKIPGSMITIWVYVNDLAFDYSVKFSTELEKLEENGSLATCLSDGEDVKGCFADSNIDLSTGFSIDSESTAPEFLLCPDNFVAVPNSSRDDVTEPFCVAKYEMKNDADGRTVSAAGETHQLVASKNDALTACESMGPGFALINNSEWIAISRNIESSSINWRQIQIGVSGQVNSGHHKNLPPSLLSASPNDSNSCFQIDHACKNGTWNVDKRTHILSNDSVIWDFAGNAWEVIDFSPGIPTNSPSIFDIAGRWKEMNTVSPVQGLTASDYKSEIIGLNSANGIGEFYITDLFALNGGYTALRGGSRFDALASGIYGVAFSSDEEISTLSHDELGFRCVFHPTIAK